MSNLVYVASKKHGIPANVYAAILMQESSYHQFTAAKKCGYVLREDVEFSEEACVQTDIGISQINYDTIQRYGFDPERLYNDLEYAVDSGARVLSWFYKTYGNDPDWYVRYNCGTKEGTDRETCQVYKTRVARWM